ncbi:MAG: redoxin domain-containing protein [Oscillatoriales cyanobacterium RM2_1_1]|nr:redoxin domain-containing protein [Oscillatoriales cyanobacterium SM2_3_0]NJO45476.1 redoxin domain-containing protein [Oscillatoriales cyanobacterium RM2_1_1]
MESSISEAQFNHQVLRSSTLVLVHFWAPWCGLCRLILPQLRQFQAQWQGEVKIVGVNADQNLKLASTYRLKTLPTLILFQNGQILYRVEHFQGRDDLRRALDQLMEEILHESIPAELQPQECLTLEA